MPLPQAVPPGADNGREHCLVTGVAGFIGSHLAERLLELGHTVTGVDAFTDYYERAIKERNLQRLQARPGFHLRELDLARDDLEADVAAAGYVFHQAGQPGVRTSWGDDFGVYLRDNVQATQRLLEAARRSRALRRFVYASSSSVYGNPDTLPVTESVLPRPFSPYGVTKLAGEQLCSLYAANFGLPTVSLRYFTVYGPRQRPDMAFSRFTAALLGDGAIRINGDGEQTRDFTFVSDAVEANLLAAYAEGLAPGAIYNIGGGARVTVNKVIAELERICGAKATVSRGPVQDGDARHTYADTSAARRELGYRPRVSLADGLRAQVDWARHSEGVVTR